ncbi:MAG TPA: hypothetical protein DCM08_10540 [Microscillaceae bacterium]|jgi:osmoprotectant transport system ATP-binding protein|nr:hypothetical protein [Microscillaceae bacterium]
MNIVFEAVSKRLGGTLVLHDFSLSIASGEKIALMGLSGSGKTTALKLINGLLQADTGQITLEGRPLASYPIYRLRHQIGYVIQQVGLFPHFTVRQNIAVVPRLAGWRKPQIDARLAELLGLLRLDEALLDRFPHQLSGGQAQRVGIARALAVDPPVLLLDEPFAALDPIYKAEIWAEFLELPALRHKTILLVSHDATESATFAQKIAFLHEGKLVQIDSPLNILLQPKHPTIERFFNPHRLEVAMHFVKLANLVPWLLPTEAAPSTQKLVFGGEHTFAQAWRKAEESRATLLCIEHLPNAQPFFTTTTQLWNAFEAYWQSQKVAFATH